MAILFRVFLFSVLIYLIIRLVREFFSSPKDDDKKVKSTANERKVSKDVGEYVEYEEIEGKEHHTSREAGRDKSEGKRTSDKGNKTRDYR